MTLTRVVATPSALDATVVPSGAITMRVAPDEALFVDVGAVQVDDEHAIVVDDGGWCGAWFPRAAVDRWLTTHSTWQLPAAQRCFEQGMMAAAPVKLWADGDRVLLLVPHVAARDLAERLAS